MSEQVADFANTTRVLGNIRAQLDIVPDVLRGQLIVGVDRSESTRRIFLPSANPVGAEFNGLAHQHSRDLTNLTFQGLLTYSQSFGDAHDVEVVGGYEWQDFETDEFVSEARDFVTDAFGFDNLAAGAELVFHLAAETGADGVHIGQEDTAYEEARRLVGAQAIVGVTCHDVRHLAIEAAEKGADYVAFGAFYPTTTKTPKGHPRLDILRWWSALMTVPCVAIGGIKVNNCAPLIQAGADFLAVVTGVWDYPAGPAAAVKAFNQAIQEALD